MILAGSIAAAAPTVVSAQTAAGESPISLAINNTIIHDLDAPPVIYNDFTLVPARDVFESLGAQVGWVPPTQEIFVSFGESVLSMQVDSRHANVGGSLIEMSIPPRIINDRTMIPLRFVSEAFGFGVYWDPHQRIAHVSSPGIDILQAGGFPDNFVLPQIDLPGQEPAPTAPPEPMPQVQNEHGRPLGSAQETNGTMPRDISPFAIPAQSHPRVSLTAVNDASAEVFLEMVSYGLTADGPISRVDKLFLYGNRIVLDIHNSANSLPSVTPMSSQFVRQVRTSSTGNNVTRVVFDLHDTFDTAVTISEDRRRVFLSFPKNNATGLTFDTTETRDTLTIDLNFEPRHSISFRANPNRFVIDLPGTSVEGLQNVYAQGRFVSGITAEQYSATLGRVTVHLSGEISMQSSVDGNSLVVSVTAPTHRNISFDHSTRSIVVHKAGLGIQTSAITRHDEYLQLRYTLHMGYNLLHHLGYGSLPVDDEFLEAVRIHTDDAGQTSLIISQRRIMAFVVEESAENIYIRARLPREVHAHIVVIDPGHGGSDAGAVHGGRYEKTLNLQMSAKIINNIRQSGYIQVYTTRIDDTFVSLEDRARFANELGDLFISVHNNAVDVRRGGNPATNGAETFYWPRPNADPNAITSREASDIIHDRLIAKTGQNDRGVRQAQFVVLSQTTMPAVFLEVGFMTNAEELQRLADPIFQQLVADAVYAGIREVFAVYAPRR